MIVGYLLSDSGSLLLRRVHGQLRMDHLPSTCGLGTSSEGSIDSRLNIHSVHHSLWRGYLPTYFFHEKTACASCDHLQGDYLAPTKVTNTLQQSSQNHTIYISRLSPLSTMADQDSNSPSPNTGANVCSTAYFSFLHRANNIKQSKRHLPDREDSRSPKRLKTSHDVPEALTEDKSVDDGKFESNKASKDDESNMFPQSRSETSSRPKRPSSRATMETLILHLQRFPSFPLHLRAFPRLRQRNLAMLRQLPPRSCPLLPGQAGTPHHRFLALLSLRTPPSPRETQTRMIQRMRTGLK